MQSNEKSVEHKMLEKTLVARIRIHGKVSDLQDVFTKLNSIAGARAAGSPIVVHHWGVNDEDGHDMDVCLPLKNKVEGNGISTTYLPVKDAMTTIHRGLYSEIGEAYTRVTKHTYERGHPIAESTREVFHHLDTDHPEKTVVEIQTILHDWTHRFSSKLETVLGSEIREEVLEPMKNLNIDTPTKDRQEALRKSLSILERKTDAEQQYEILSHCAHVFPVELIPPMRDLFKSTGSVDAVIDEMVSRGGYYPKLMRHEGSIVYSEKGPANPKAYKEATTDAERRRAYCFCPLIRDSLDEAPEIFCNCSAGWPKQLWEGILERPLKVDIVQSLTKGDDTCEFAIHLPAGIL